jgi:hypothetical protein
MPGSAAAMAYRFDQGLGGEDGQIVFRASALL